MTVTHTMGLQAPDEHLLVIDFDFFFPNPMEGADLPGYHPVMFDWGHREAPIFLSNMIWATRAATFLRSGLALPGMVPPEGGWSAFWGRFNIALDAPMAWADSNMHAGELRADDGYSPFASVDLYDAHHDSGYHKDDIQEWLDGGTYSCEDWMLCHQLAGTPELTVHYPQWKTGAAKAERKHLPKGVITKLAMDDGQPVDKVYTSVFVCRSGAWVPSWCDPDFAAFLAASGREFEQLDDEPMDREFDIEAARRDAEAIDAAFASMREQQESATS